MCMFVKAWPAADPLWLHSITANKCIHLLNATDILKCLWFLYSYSFLSKVPPFLHPLFHLSSVYVCLVHDYTKPNFLLFPHSNLFSAQTMFFVPLDLRKIAGKMKYTSEHCGHHVMFVNDPLRATGGEKKCWAAQIWSSDIQSWELLHSLALQAERESL